MRELVLDWATGALGFEDVSRGPDGGRPAADEKAFAVYVAYARKIKNANDAARAEKMKRWKINRKLILGQLQDEFGLKKRQIEEMIARGRDGTDDHLRVREMLAQGRDAKAKPDSNS